LKIVGSESYKNAMIPSSPHGNLQSFDKRKVINKTSKHFNKKKYLLTVTRIERSVHNPEELYS